MLQEAKDTTNTIMIGRDANDTEIKINADDFNAAVKLQVEKHCADFAPQIKKLEKSIEELDNQSKIKNKEVEDAINKIKWVGKKSNIAAFIVLVTGISVLILLAICLWLPCCHYENSASFLVSVLSVLVVVLMGWQIFNILDLKEYRGAIVKMEGLKETIGQLKEQLRELTKENTSRIKELGNAFIKIDDLGKDIVWLQRQEQSRNKYSCLLPEIKELKGMMYESTDVGKAIKEYLIAIHMVIDLSDETRAILFLDRVSNLWDNSEEVRNLFKTEPDVLRLFDAIKAHPHYRILSIPSFLAFEKKVEKYNKNKNPE